MKKIKTIPKIVENREIVESIICDICKKDVNLGKESWENNEITIEAVIGENYPENDNRQLYIIDCCHTCFLKKVKPLIEKELKCSFREMTNDERYQKHE